MVTLQVGVKAVLLNSENKCLLLHRSPQKYPDVSPKDGWDIVGGRIDPGVSLMENLNREIFEETGLSLNGDVRLIAAQDIIPNPEKHVVRLTYVAKIDGTPTLSDEHDQYGWFSLDEMRGMEGLDKYLKGVLDKI